VSRVRAGEIEGLGRAGDACLFCDRDVVHGAFWRGAQSLYVCLDCTADGELGKLLGDAARDSRDLVRMLDATAREAWRALALAQERAGK